MLQNSNYVLICFQSILDVISSGPVTDAYVLFTLVFKVFPLFTLTSMEVREAGFKSAPTNTGKSATCEYLGCVLNS